MLAVKLSVPDALIIMRHAIERMTGIFDFTLSHAGQDQAVHLVAVANAVIIAVPASGMRAPLLFFQVAQAVAVAVPVGVTKLALHCWISDFLSRIGAGQVFVVVVQAVAVTVLTAVTSRQVAKVLQLPPVRQTVAVSVGFEIGVAVAAWQARAADYDAQVGVYHACRFGAVRLHRGHGFGRAQAGLGRIVGRQCLVVLRLGGIQLGSDLGAGVGAGRIKGRLGGIQPGAGLRQSCRQGEHLVGQLLISRVLGGFAAVVKAQI